MTGGQKGGGEKELTASQQRKPVGSEPVSVRSHLLTVLSLLVVSAYCLSEQCVLPPS